MFLWTLVDILYLHKLKSNSLWCIFCRFHATSNFCSLNYFEQCILIHVYDNSMMRMVQLKITSNYCKTLIIRVTLFSRSHQHRFIHETLFSRFAIYSSIFLTLEIIGEDFIFASLCSREFTRKLSPRVQKVFYSTHISFGNYHRSNRQLLLGLQPFYNLH